MKVKINLSAEEIKAKYGDNLKEENEGDLYDVLLQLFNNLVGIKKIIVPSDAFKSSKGFMAIICSVKAAVGYLYPLKYSLVFIHKKVMYIRYSELKYVEFGRTKVGAQITFDLTLTTIKGDQDVTFLSIEKEEQEALFRYFQRSNIKVRATDPQPSVTQYRVPTIREDASSSFDFREASLSSFQEQADLLPEQPEVEQLPEQQEAVEEEAKMD